jgi:hypothetical protein
MTYGVIGNSTEVDYFDVYLEAGQGYDFSVTGYSLPDSTLTLYDQNYNFISFDDDSGPGLDSYIDNFFPSSTGTYHLAVASYNGLYTGDYDVASHWWYEGSGDGNSPLV